MGDRHAISRGGCRTRALLALGARVGAIVRVSGGDAGVAITILMGSGPAVITLHEDLLGEPGQERSLQWAAERMDLGRRGFYVLMASELHDLA